MSPVYKTNHRHSFLIPAMHFPSQLKSWLPERRYSKARGNRRIPVQSSDRKAQITTEKGKGIKTMIYRASTLSFEDSAAYLTDRTRARFRKLLGSKKIHYSSKPPRLNYIGGISASESSTEPKHALRNSHHGTLALSCNEHPVRKPLCLGV